MIWTYLEQQIAAATASVFRLQNRQSLGGGCINNAWRLEGDDGRCYFAKLNQARYLDMFEAEAAALREMAGVQAVRVPAVACVGSYADQAYLVLEHLTFGAGPAVAEALLGRQLAQQHRASQTQFGWWRDNTIGSTPQINTPCADWVEFWRVHRLGYQLRLLEANGQGGVLMRQGEQLMNALPAFFADYTPIPSMLHGDLWSGNHAFTTEGEPVLFDPALYYGDREADLAMTELFGGFGADFYAAYREAWPLDHGYATRKLLYNLYHILNHINLFGSGYLAQAQRMLGQLSSELR